MAAAYLGLEPLVNSWLDFRHRRLGAASHKLWTRIALLVLLSGLATCPLILKPFEIDSLIYLWDALLFSGVLLALAGAFRTPESHRALYQLQPELMCRLCGWSAAMALGAANLRGAYIVDDPFFRTSFSLMPLSFAWGEMMSVRSTRVLHARQGLIGIAIACLACVLYWLMKLSVAAPYRDSVDVILAISIGLLAQWVYHLLSARLQKRLAYHPATHTSWQQWLMSLAADLLPRLMQPLRTAAVADGLMLEAFSLDPNKHSHVQLTGVTRQSNESIPAAVLDCIRQYENPVVFLDILERETVRQPSLRPWLEWLGAKNALMSIALSPDSEPKAVLLVSDPTQTHLARRIHRVIAELDLVWIDQMTHELEHVQIHERHQTHLNKAYDDISHLNDALELAQTNATTAQRLMHFPIWTQDQPSDALSALGPFVSAQMQALEKRIQHVAVHREPKWIWGAPGTEVLTCARAVHAAGPLSQGPLLAVNAALYRPEEWLQHLVGDSQEPTESWLSLAQGGTLVVQNVMALDETMQMQLSHIFSSRRFRAQDHQLEQPVDCQIILTSISNEPPPDEAGLGLWGWLKENLIFIPSLRDRSEDFSAIVHAELAALCQESALPPSGIDAHALTKLSTHTWPGNRDELHLTLKLALLRAKNHRITSDDIAIMSSSDG